MHSARQTVRPQAVPKHWVPATQSSLFWQVSPLRRLPAAAQASFAAPALSQPTAQRLPAPQTASGARGSQVLGPSGAPASVGAPPPQVGALSAAQWAQNEAVSP